MKNPFKKQEKELEFLVADFRVDPKGQENTSKYAHHEEDLDTYRVLDSLFNRVCLQRNRSRFETGELTPYIEFLLPGDMTVRLAPHRFDWRDDEEKPYLYIAADVRIRTTQKQLPTYIQNILSAAGVPHNWSERRIKASEMTRVNPYEYMMNQNTKDALEYWGTHPDVQCP